MATIYATCQTPGCPEHGTQTELTDPMPIIVCGVCGQEITDKTSQPTPLPEEMPAWDL
ncbi:hypothetical protein NQ036_06760 [Brevibacterium sp. 91QC2O2]|uniref:hypothetical protein n=1 Tax=Brevibacterium sp. 91QC2O2 TaxID=2968458 RepID=UPI00211BAC3E|nr:hypothetical protein [Brevibacterium sp. 91QC2O2]MCQ9367944.1 hypothetical protein [Brevibacterium sp. 91QC2O2]